MSKDSLLVSESFFTFVQNSLDESIVRSDTLKSRTLELLECQVLRFNRIRHFKSQILPFPFVPKSPAPHKSSWGLYFTAWMNCCQHRVIGAVWLVFVSHRSAPVSALIEEFWFSFPCKNPICLILFPFPFHSQTHFCCLTGILKVFYWILLENTMLHKKQKCFS